MDALLSIGRFFAFWAFVVVVTLGGLALLLAPSEQAVAPLSPEGATAASLLQVERAALPTIAPTLQPLVLDDPSDTDGFNTALTPLGAPTPSPSQADMRARVADMLASLHSGSLTAITTYRDGSRASARLRFDLGDAQHPPRLHYTAGYVSAGGAYNSEQIVIGDQAWQRGGADAWAAVPQPVSVAEALRDFLPSLDHAQDVQVHTDPSAVVLGWYEAGRNADMLLLADLASGMPQQLTQTARDTDSVLAITYLGWNEPVTIEPPPFK